MDTIKDQVAYERLKTGSDPEIRALYPLFSSSFVSFICKSFRCPRGKAEEIYPEAFTILYFNIRKGKLTAPLKSSIQTYLNSTGWNLYHRRHLDKYQREKLSFENIGHEIETGNMVEEALLQQERARQIHQLLNRIGEPCSRILVQFYFHEKTFKELSVEMNVEASTLRKRKFDCLLKMRNLIKELKVEL